eukprot:GAFH01004567.1.p1 GENE.GAFH01004567.1~~GAFH01004567.1.p1  ORF type:complete len:247 (+),score=5.21 GAFH01004567.1:15-755(+)
MATTRVPKTPWIPLESNPDVINQYVHKLGAPDSWQFHDVFGLDDEMFEFVPKPVKAVVFLFPIPDDDDEEEEEVAPAPDSADAFFVYQRIGNACGTIACLHAFGNNRDQITFTPGSFFARYFATTRHMTPDQRADELEEDRALPELREAHAEAAVQGQTEVPQPDDRINLHFVAFALHGGILYEFDGRRDAPVPHGPSSEATILSDVARVVRAFVEKHPETIQFSLMALSPGSLDAQPPSSTVVPN